MAHIIMCCGKICSGKAEFARILEQEQNFFYLSADHFMLHFFGANAGSPQMAEQQKRCEEMIFELSDKLLKSGRDVVLDSGFWARDERYRTRIRFEGAGFITTFIYFPVDEETQYQNFLKRKKENPAARFHLSWEEILELNRRFEIPQPHEVVFIQDYV